MSAKPTRRGAVAALLVALYFALCAAARISDNSGQPAISEVTVLLPFTTEHETVSKVLTAKNGCFRWFAATSSTHAHARTRKGQAPAAAASEKNTRCVGF